MRSEWLARILIALLLVAALTIPAAAAWQRNQGIVLHARMAETGGWTPENLTAVVGEPLHLRLTSDDVTHSFAIGKADELPGKPATVDVIPGEMTEVTLVFDKPGKYTFYCTRWCSLNHWRMRGVIEVRDPNASEVNSQESKPPLYVTLGMDIDAPHQAETIPEQKPSAIRDAELEQSIPEIYLNRQYYQANAPVQLWNALRIEPGLLKLSNQEIWDLVARVWKSNTTLQELEEGRQLYSANCAACHGESGAGNGVFADELAQPNTGQHADMKAGTMTTRPADFTDPTTMLSASPAHLQGKIIRGGMGTGMPYWGPIFTEEQTWALVAYLWTFQFEMETKP